VVDGAKLVQGAYAGSSRCAFLRNIGRSRVHRMSDGFVVQPIHRMPRSEEHNQRSMMVEWYNCTKRERYQSCDARAWRERESRSVACHAFCTFSSSAHPQNAPEFVFVSMCLDAYRTTRLLCVRN
jgi:hypothetical protein